MAPTIEHPYGISCAKPQHSRQVLGLLGWQFDPFAGRVLSRHEEARTHVAIISSCYTRRTPSMFFRGQTIGKYRILSTLGSGGFGTVYLAEDTWIDKKVAIKVPHKQPLDFSELLKEPRLLASMSHPNIVTVITAEKEDDVFFIVMEYVAGQTLEHLIMREGPLDLTRSLDFACQMCNAVDHAHQAGILHRDLRPGNMLVSENGMLKVTDFGTSRFLEIAAHGTTVIGSPPYMAPEQFYGKAVFASDVYSLGITIYQMLTGSMPYDTPAPGDIARLARGELLTSPRLKNPKIPKAINDIVLRAMAPELTARYQRAGDLMHDLLAAREPVAVARRSSARSSAASSTGDHVSDIQSRLRAREAPQASFCWHCRKPLQARTAKCPFCGESQ
jgi:serine/threonine-protein kinase